MVRGRSASIPSTRGWSVPKVRKPAVSSDRNSSSSSSRKHRLAGPARSVTSRPSRCFCVGRVGAAYRRAASGDRRNPIILSSEAALACFISRRPLLTTARRRQAAALLDVSSPRLSLKALRIPADDRSAGCLSPCERLLPLCRRLVRGCRPIVQRRQSGFRRCAVGSCCVGARFRLSGGARRILHRRRFPVR